MMIAVVFCFLFSGNRIAFCLSLQALMDSNLPRLQLELYKEIKKVNHTQLFFMFKTSFINTWQYIELEY